MYRKDYEQRLKDTNQAYYDVRKLQNRTWDLTNGYWLEFRYEDYTETAKYPYRVLQGGNYFHHWEQMPFPAFERLYFYKELIAKWLANELADLPPTDVKDRD